MQNLLNMKSGNNWTKTFDDIHLRLIKMFFIQVVSFLASSFSTKVYAVLVHPPCISCSVQVIYQNLIILFKVKITNGEKTENYNLFLNINSNLKNLPLLAKASFSLVKAICQQCAHPMCPNPGHPYFSYIRY
jgi:hypothetical protein